MSDTRNFFAQVPRSSFDTPGKAGGLVDVFRWHYLLRLLVRTGVTTRYRNSVLGWTWSYVRPAAQFLVFWVVLGLFLNLERGIPNYAVYLFSGIVVINLFSEAFKNATTSIVGNAPLVRKVYLPRQLFAVSAVIVAFVHFLPQVGLLLVVCLFLGWITSHLDPFGPRDPGGCRPGDALRARTRPPVRRDERALPGRREHRRAAAAAGDLGLAGAVLLDDGADAIIAGWPSWLLELYLLNPITQAVELFHFAFWYPVTETRSRCRLPLARDQHAVDVPHRRRHRC